MEMSRAALYSIRSHCTNPVFSVEVLFKFASMMLEKVRWLQMLSKDALCIARNSFNAFVARIDSVLSN